MTALATGIDRFIVFGAGAIGGVVGARLAQAGHDVALVARGAHKEVIERDGLRIEDPDAVSRVEVPVTDDVATLDPGCLLYTSPSPRDRQKSRMPSSA